MARISELTVGCRIRYVGNYEGRYGSEGVVTAIRDESVQHYESGYVRADWDDGFDFCRCPRFENIELIDEPVVEEDWS